jgi:hypothetical protein
MGKKKLCWLYMILFQLHGKSPTPIPSWQLPYPKAVASGVVEVAIASILASSSSLAVGEAWVKLFLSQVVTCWFYFSPRHCDSNLQDYTPEITFSRISQDVSAMWEMLLVFPNAARFTGVRHERFTGSGTSECPVPRLITWGCRKVGETWVNVMFKMGYV